MTARRVLIATALLSVARIAHGQALVRADRAWNDGERVLAEQLYAQALTEHPDASRAVYRLAMLRRDRPDESIALLRRYAALEPTDAWGHLALADALSRAGEHRAALDAVARAERLAPAERDVVAGHAKVLERAGRLDAAAATLSAWVTAHPDDVDAWRSLAAVRRRVGRERGTVDALAHVARLAPHPRTTRQLARARTTAAPRLGAQVRGARDSDANATQGATLSLDGLVADRVRLGIAATTRGASYAGTDASVREGLARLAWRPRATLTLAGDVGAVRLAAGPSAADTIVVTTTTTTPGTTTNNGNGKGKGRGGSASGGTTTTVATPVIVVHPGAAAEALVIAHGRLRWRAPDGATIVDVRAGRAPLEATPALLANRVVRADAGITLERAVAGPVRVRALAQGARYDERLHAAADTSAATNARTTLGGGPVVDVADGVQLGVSVLRSRWRHATTAGYFAPATADLAEVGMYLERELGAAGATLAVDAGAGAQRLQPFGDVMGAWRPAGRLWAQLAVPLGRATLTSEVDVYRSQLGGEAATTASWSSASGAVALRLPLR